MDLIKLQLLLFGSYCNSWPKVFVRANGNRIWTGDVIDEICVDLEFPRQATNIVDIGMVNKRSGPAVYDTVLDQHSNIVQDKSVQIKQILLDGSRCGWLLNSMSCTYADQTTRTNLNGFLGQNGFFRFEFPDDIYTWVAEQRNSKIKSAGPQSSLDYRSIYFNDSNEEIYQTIQECYVLLSQFPEQTSTSN